VKGIEIALEKNGCRQFIKSTSNPSMKCAWYSKV